MQDEIKKQGEVVISKQGGFIAFKCDKTIVSALERRIPKKPINIASITYIPACPQCKGTVTTYEKCCEHCGQALDWSNEE